MEFEGIVIRRTLYKGDDVMINVLTKEKIQSFLAKGVLKPTSKNSYSTNMFTRSRFQIFHGKEGNFLRVGEVIDSYPNINNDLEKLTLLDFVSEITNLLLDKKDSENAYPFLQKLLESINTGFSPWTATLIYFAKVMTIAGYGLNVDNCQKCGKTTEISAVSFSSGGFICKDCLRVTNSSKTDTRKLKIYRYIFKVDEENFTRIAFEKDECKEIMIELINFLMFVGQFELKSLTLLEKI